MTIDEDLARTLPVLNPAQLWLRFYGRFLFVKTRAELIVLAANVCSDGTDHKVFLTIREMNAKSPQISPSSRLVATEVVPFQGALNVWSIDGCSIDVSGKPGFTWPPPKQIRLANLNTLAKGCTVNTKFLDPYQPLKEDCKFTAFIRIREGSQVAFHLPTKDIGARWAFWPTPQPDDPKALADMAQIAMSLPSEGVNLTFNQLPPGMGTAGSSICVSPSVDPIVVVSFSNLCTRAAASAEEGYIDHEFASFYDVFDTPPPTRLVPQLKSLAVHLGRSEPRQGDARTANTLVNTFRPMGDCFLGAMVELEPQETSRL